MSEISTPLATYRLQLNKDFTLDDAMAIADYLKTLGISHLYLSPIFASTPGSNHGYDITDFTKISEERGGENAFQKLHNFAEKNGLKIILDIVPNHMGVDMSNSYWQDVLKNGRNSPHWSLFDMRLEDNEKIHIPVLGSSLEECLSKDEISIDGDKIKYFKKTFPICDEALELLYKNPNTPIHDILERQHYRLVKWTEIFEKVSYRRFFDVVDLICVRVEEKENYEKTHQALRDILKKYPQIDGVRVDHVDGLADPKAYLENLSQDVKNIWIEKILGREEELCPSWPVKGTTGYEFIDRINQVFVNAEGFKKIEAYWISKVEEKWKDFHACVDACKARALKDLFNFELTRLVNLSTDREEDKTPARIFWSGMLLGLPVYRSYCVSGQASQTDKHFIEKARVKAREILGEEFTRAEERFLPLLLEPRNDKEIQLAREWQQLSGPVMAKGLEDTAHYRYTPLVALNEVGCEPVISSNDLDEFFDWLQTRAEQWPEAMKATSTHDTKRSEDTRARLYALADYADEWIAFFEEASRINAAAKVEYKGSRIPTAETEYFLYQAIIGIWPLTGDIDDEFKTRIKAYMQKSDREARQETNWLNPCETYENEIADFIDHILANPDFVKLASELACKIAPAGAINSLAVQALKILSPGVPDIYQGTESFDFSLVDPDNRRAVDYKLRQYLLGKDKDDWRTGSTKILLTQKLLEIRRDHILPLQNTIQLIPLQAKGEQADNLIAYILTDKNRHSGLIVALPRFPGLMAPDNLSLAWTDISLSLPDFAQLKKLHDCISGQSISSFDVKALLSNYPIAVISF